jgi:hypothetical protein
LLRFEPVFLLIAVDGLAGCTEIVARMKEIDRVAALRAKFLLNLIGYLWTLNGNWFLDEHHVVFSGQFSQQVLFGLSGFFLIRGTALFDELNAFDQGVPVHRGNFPCQSLIGEQSASTGTKTTVKTAKGTVGALGQGSSNRAEHAPCPVALPRPVSSTLTALVCARYQPQPRGKVLGRSPDGKIVPTSLANCNTE